VFRRALDVEVTVDAISHPALHPR